MRRVVVTVVGTLALHGAIALGLREIEPLGPIVPVIDAPEIEIIELEPPEPVPVPAPVPDDPEPEQEAEPDPQPRQQVRSERARAPRTAAATATTSTTSTVAEPAGGTGAVLKMDLGAQTTGVAVSPGKGGRGGGEGSGPGTGTGTGTGAAPLTVAAIKTPAKAKEGYDYFDAGRDYPAEARRLEIEGQVKVRLVVDARGKVTEARLVTRLGHGLDQLALARARKIEFLPARDAHDRAVASVVVWTVTFVLPR